MLSLQSYCTINLRINQSANTFLLTTYVNLSKQNNISLWKLLIFFVLCSRTLRGRILPLLLYFIKLVNKCENFIREKENYMKSGFALAPYVPILQGNIVTKRSIYIWIKWHKLDRLNKAGKCKSIYWQIRCHEIPWQTLSGIRDCDLKNKTTFKKLPC